MYWVAASTAAAIASAAAMMAAAWTSSLVLHMNASNSQHPRGDYSPATGISPSHPGRGACPRATSVRFSWQRHDGRRHGAMNRRYGA